jgi:hypothetical protein
MNWVGLGAIEPRVCLALALCGWLLTSCATAQRHPDGQALGFVPLATDARVWLEPGAEAYAERVSAYLDQAVSRVERLHGLPFRSPLRVHVCASESCFTRWVQTPGLTAAVVADNRLVLSPRLHGQEAPRLPGILTHELSHLHLGQRLGHYTPWIPVWLHEGLATLAADGAGADATSDAQACAAWRSGRRVDFNRRDAPGRRHRASEHGLDIHGFYRQSWRALQRLHARDEGAFGRWLQAVQEGVDFHIAFADIYNTDPNTLLTAMLNQTPIGADLCHE